MSATAAASATGAAFGLFGPSFLDVRKFDPSDPEHRTELRLGEGSAAAAGFIVASAIAIGEKSWKPYIYWAAVTAGLFLAYECAFRYLGRSDYG